MVSDALLNLERLLPSSTPPVPAGSRSMSSNASPFVVFEIVDVAIQTQSQDFGEFSGRFRAARTNKDVVTEAENLPHFFFGRCVAHSVFYGKIARLAGCSVLKLLTCHAMASLLTGIDQGETQSRHPRKSLTVSQSAKV